MKAKAGFGDDELIAILPNMKYNALSMTHNEDKANDLVQATAERMIANKHQFTRGTSLMAWACTIMRNYHIGLGRKLNRELQWPELGLDIPATDDQAAAYEAKETLQRLASIKMSSKMWQAVIDVRVGGMGYSEAAVQANVAVGTIKSRMHRAKMMLSQVS